LNITPPYGRYDVVCATLFVFTVIQYGTRNLNIGNTSVLYPFFANRIAEITYNTKADKTCNRYV
jgi:hypothetical protein